MSTTIDRTGWPAGPWDGEPDRVEWRTEAGLPALIRRHPYRGHLCGYVGVPEEHPAWRRSYRDVAPIDVHGELTYSGFNADVPGLPLLTWWLGFDCGHAWDRTPTRRGDWDDSEYRTIAFARAECERLAAQLAGMR